MLPPQDVMNKAVQRLGLELQRAPKLSDSFVLETSRSRDEVLARYQPIFSPENIGIIAKEDFRSFLVPKNNKHWYGLQRRGSIMTENMDKLREALKILVDESVPVQQRLDIILSPKRPKVKGLGPAVVTAILLIDFPESYGAMNNISLKGADKLGLMPKFIGSETFGERYLEFNEMLLTVSHQLGVDLWIMDMLWYMVLGKDHWKK
jgi:thermostable 8-oxoguanine DNA glycosylase